MQFEALDRTMRVYETAHDHQVLSDIWLGRLRTLEELPAREAYSVWVAELLRVQV